jgi:diguanylate cyclase (GGDEF)-like protein/PAS domain S-box-containing protein
MSKEPENKPAELRRRAEASLAWTPLRNDPTEPTDEKIHALLVHQTELEMQNDELRCLQALLDKERSRYFDLFDMAPVAYITLDDQDNIREANLTAASLFGLPREKLSRHPLARLIQTPDQDLFYLARKKLHSEGKPQWCELRLKKGNGNIFWGRMEIAAVAQEGWQDACRISISDISEAVKNRQNMALREQQYRLLAKNMSDVIILIKKGVIEWVSPSVTTALGWTIHDMAGQPAARFLNAAIIEEKQVKRNLFAAGQSIVSRERMAAKDGTNHWVEIHASPYLDEQGNIDGVVAACRIVDEEVAAKRELERRALTDELTNLLNRKAVLDHLDAFGRNQARTGHALAVLFCDLDRFKTINDNYGHAAGDEVLRVMADRIRGCLRSSDDLAARMGGDELLVVLHGVQDLASASHVAEKLCRSAAEPVPIPGGSVRTTMSIGVTLARPSERTDDLVARADMAMYQAKQTGRNQVIPIPPPES